MSGSPEILIDGYRISFEHGGVYLGLPGERSVAQTHLRQAVGHGVALHLDENGALIGVEYHPDDASAPS
jgi:hypothetical protein